MIITSVLIWFTGSNQLEDPHLQWRDEQSRMLSDYLVVANEDLAVCSIITSQYLQINIIKKAKQY